MEVGGSFKMWGITMTILVVSTFASTVAKASTDPADTVSAPTLQAWGIVCPSSCKCHAGPLKEVPLHKEFHSKKDFTSVAKDDPWLAADRETKQAVCMILSSKYEAQIRALPKDTESLQLIQGADNGSVILTSEVLSQLAKLIALDITSFSESVIILKSDALKGLPDLHLLGLTGVDLEGTLEGPEEEETVPPPSLHPRRRLPPWAYRTDKQGNLETPHLVFLKPAEVVPYSKYSEIRRESALRTFAGLDKLTLLRLHRADLLDLAWEMFEGLDSLQVLSLEDNGLAYVPGWSLYGAPKLRSLSLANNELLEVVSTALVGLLELRELDLSHNNISHLSELSLPPFPLLKHADFRGNPIENVFSSTFQVMNATKKLFLGGSGTPLRLVPDMFLGLRALWDLVATDVTVPALDRDILRGTPYLRRLTLRGYIPILAYDAFVEVPKLEELILQRCAIRSVSMDAFYGLFALSVLDLSHNQLRSLPFSLLDQLTHLQELHLTGNQLTELPPSLFQGLPLKMARLDGNPWNCSCDMASWSDSVVNKVKEKCKEDCHYMYDRRVSPTCETPADYHQWTVFRAVRKLRCNKNSKKSPRPSPNAVPVDAIEPHKLVAPLLDNRVIIDPVTTAAPPKVNPQRATSSPEPSSSPPPSEVSGTSTSGWTTSDAGLSSSSSVWDGPWTTASAISGSTGFSESNVQVESTSKTHVRLHGKKRRKPQQRLQKEGYIEIEGGCKVLEKGRYITLMSRKACKIEYQNRPVATVRSSAQG